MFERSATIILLFSALLLPTSASRADQVTLRDGSVYSALRVIGYDGEKNLFRIEKAGKELNIRSRDVATVEIDSARGGLILREGSAYSNLDILSFDLPNDRLKVGRSGKTLDLPLSDIARVRIGGAFEEIEPVNSEETITAGAAPSQAAKPVNEPSAGWSEDGLYSNLPEDFGRKQVLPPGGEASPSTYTPRWKAEASGKGTARGAPGAPASPSTATATTARSAPERPAASPSTPTEIPPAADERPQLEGVANETIEGTVEMETDFGSAQARP